MAIIEFKNVTKVYGKKVVLDNINFEVKKNDIFGIIGASGSGKTTILNLMIGYQKSDDGEILYQPQHSKTNYLVPIKSKSREVKRTFGFAAQNPSFYPKLTVTGNLYYFASLYGLPKKEIKANTNTLLELMELTDAKNDIAENLSGGMQKRLDIACALIHDPDVLILDEPTADLDPMLRQQMWDLIKKINKRGTTIVLSSHFLDEIEELCTNIGMLHKGRMAHTGAPEDIKKKYTVKDKLYAQTKPGNYEQLKRAIEGMKHAHIHKVSIEGNKIIIETPNAEKVLHDLLNILERANETLFDVHIAKPSLNDVFEEVEKTKEVVK